MTPVSSLISRPDRKRMATGDSIVNYLVDHFNSPHSRSFFQMAVYSIPRYKLAEYIKRAGQGREPVKLFVHLCSEHKKTAV